jgi:hypothetical protein
MSGRHLAWGVFASSLFLAAALTTPAEAPAATPAEKRLTAYTTAYDIFDNTPAGSAEISNPVIHKKAGGTGTYANPVTLAVGHSLATGKDVLDYPAGSRFYLPDLRKYAIVEDTCGDGKTPQNRPCHRLDTPGNKAPKGAAVWVDVWIGGQGSTTRQGDACMSKVTDGNGAVHTIIQHPRSTYRVVPGPVLDKGKCTAGYGNTAKTR